MIDKPNINRNDFEYVETIDLAEFIQSLPRVDILKIDIEGSEVFLVPYLISSGCLENVEHIFVETHEKKWLELTLHTNRMLEIVNKSKYALKFNFTWI